MGLLPPNPLCAGSAVQINGFGPIPAGTVGLFGQQVCATPPDFANSLFQKSILGGATIETGEANMSMGANSFTTLVGAAATAITNGLGPSASTSGSFEDQLIIGINPAFGGTGSGTMIIPLHITGSVGMTFTTPVGQPPFKFMEAGFSFWCETISITVTGQGGPCGGSFNFGINQGHAQFVFDHPQSVDRTFLMTIPFTFNEEFILRRAVFFSAGLIPPLTICDPTCPLVTPLYDGTVSADFSHTGMWERAIVEDADGNVLSNPSILSLSGLDYLNPEGVAPPANVPEPETLSMLLAGCLFLAFSRPLGLIKRCAVK